MVFRFEAPVLEGRRVRLEPLDHRHVAALAVAASQSQSQESYGYTVVPVSADEMADYVNELRGLATPLPPHPRQTLEGVGIAVARNDAQDVPAWSPQSAAFQPAADLDGTEPDQSRRLRLDIVSLDVQVVPSPVIHRLHRQDQPG